MTVELVIKAYLEEEERENTFKDESSGKHWWQGFLRLALSHKEKDHNTCLLLELSPQLLK